MRILLTGVRGQLGRAVQSLLGGHDVLAVDIAELDITSLQSVREAISEHRSDLVINAAAYTNVDGAESREGTEQAYRINALGPRNLALATAQKKTALLHISTDYVFDGKTNRPYHEYDAPHPLSVYGASKWAGEEAVRSMNPRHYVVRTAWLFQPGATNFLSAVRDLAARQQKVTVVSDQFGSPTYAPHLARALVQLFGTRAYGTYHLAGQGGASWYELTRVFFEHLGVSTPVVPISSAEFPRPAPRPRYGVLTTLQDPQILLPPWQEGVAEYVRSVK